MISTTLFLDKVKKRIFAPEGQAAFTDADILTMGNEEIISTVLPNLFMLLEEYAVVTRNIPLRDSGDNLIYPDLSIPIPARALAGGFREVKYKDVNGNIFNLPLVTIEDQDIATSPRYAYDTLPGSFTIKNESIVLNGVSQRVKGSLDLSIIVRPPEMSMTPKTALIDSVNSSGFLISAATADLTVSGSMLFDVYRVSTGAPLRIGLTGTRNAGNLFIDLGADEIANLNAFAGDMKIVEGELCDFVPVHREAISYLVALTGSRIYEAISDTENMGILLQQAENSWKKVSQMLGKRSIGEPKVLGCRRGIAAWLRRGWNGTR